MAIKKRKKATPKMPPKDKLDKVFLTDKEAREIKKDIADREKMLIADKASGRPKIQNEAEFAAEIKKKKAILAQHSPTKLTGAKANRAYAEAKKLKEEISGEILDRRSFGQSYPRQTDRHGNPITPDFDKKRAFDKAVQRQYALQTNPVLKRKIARFKGIMANLDPQDPTVRNIESLRR